MKYFLIGEHEYIVPGGKIQRSSSSFQSLYERSDDETKEAFTERIHNLLDSLKQVDPTIVALTVYEQSLFVGKPENKAEEL